MKPTTETRDLHEADGTIPPDFFQPVMDILDCFESDEDDLTLPLLKAGLFREVASTLIAQLPADLRSEAEAKRDKQIAQLIRGQ